MRIIEDPASIATVGTVGVLPIGEIARKQATPNIGRVELATAVLRISLGMMFLAHSVILKYLTYTLGGTAEYFQSVGLPGWLAYGVFWMEVAGGLLLVLGIAARWVGLCLMPILLGALWVHSGNGWVFTSPGGGWEYPLYLAVLCGVQFLLGGGAFTVPVLRRK